MSALDYQRMVIGYHGCDATTVTSVLLKGQSLKPSENEYDWLGRGIYFWEYGPQRAYDWACQEKKRFNKIRTPAVLGAYIHLGTCFDLLDARIMFKSHIQISVRDPACILGYFRPKGF